MPARLVLTPDSEAKRGPPDVRGPACNNIDLSLMKNTNIRETVQLQFRAEYFNVLNHPNFWQPNTAFGSQQFGTAEYHHRIAPGGQLAVKVLF
jgi:hypothetical protein